MSSTLRPRAADAYGSCITCGGHGATFTDGEEIPFGELSPRRQQGYAAGHRFRRTVWTPCGDCDGRDVVTPYMELSAEAARDAL